MPYDNDGYVRNAKLIAWGKRPRPRAFRISWLKSTSPRSIPTATIAHSRPVNKRDAMFRGIAFLSRSDAATFRIGDWAPMPARIFPRGACSAAQSPAAQLQNKLVLIGQSSDAARDQDFTPLFRVARRRRQARAHGRNRLCTRPPLKRCSTATPSAEVLPWLRWTINFLVFAVATWAFTRFHLRMAFAFAADLNGRHLHRRPDRILSTFTCGSLTLKPCSG